MFETLAFNYQFNLSSSTSNIIEDTAIYSVLIGMGAQFVACLYLTGKAFYQVWKKIKKYSAPNFVKPPEGRLTAENEIVYAIRPK